MSDTELVKNDDDKRYELHLDGERIGSIDWVRDDLVVELLHTEVDSAHGGKGYAAMLADFALSDIRDAGLTVRPTCSYVARHIESNPEYGSIVVE
ncbi:MAG: GNAT family N-acetyltransferase [Propionibacteriaceae bacterium]|nr:GNAT family N-acetyltransferase [Propionibacteriaceae bacterium]